MKKILFVITKSYFGGAQRYVFDLASALTEKGFDVAVVLGGEGLLQTKLNEANIRTITIPSLTRDVHPLKDIRTFFALLRVIQKERPDILHVNSAKAGGLGALAGRILGVRRVIFTMHGFAFNENRSLISKKVIAFFTWLTVFLSHRSIAVSKTLARQVPRALSKKITIIENGVAPISFKTREASRAFLEGKCAGLAARTSKEIFWIGTIAELHPIKGLDFAIDGIHKLKKIHPAICYVIISGGEMREKLEAQIRHHELEDTVFLAGFVEDAPEYLKAFDAFLLPSLSEGLGYVLLEAGLASLPVVATNVGGIPEIIENQKNGILIPSKNPDTIAEALTFYIENASARGEYGNALLSTAQTKFSFPTMLRRTIQTYS